MELKGGDVVILIESCICVHLLFGCVSCSKHCIMVALILYKYLTSPVKGQSDFHDNL